ncbi:MAG: DUF1254 domain-containing protein [Halieaceae bacterium]
MNCLYPILFLLLASCSGPEQDASLLQRQKANFASEQFSHHLGVIAYLYGYPMVRMYSQLHNETQLVEAEQRVYAPINRLFRWPTLETDVDLADIPCADDLPPALVALTASAWIDLADGPVILRTPALEEGLFAISLTNFYGELTGWKLNDAAGEFQSTVLAQPGVDVRPPNSTGTVYSQTTSAHLKLRLLLPASGDIDAARQKLEQLWLASLAEFDPMEPAPMPEARVATRLDPMASLGFFEILNRELQRNTARGGSEALLNQLDSIGIGPDSEFRQADLDPVRKRGLERAVRDGRAIVEAAVAGGPETWRGVRNNYLSQAVAVNQLMAQLED